MHRVNATSPVCSLTVPLLSPTTFMLLILSLIGAFQVFEYTYVMTGGGPVYATLTLVLHVYNKSRGCRQCSPPARQGSPSTNGSGSGRSACSTSGSVIDKDGSRSVTAPVRPHFVGSETASEIGATNPALPIPLGTPLR